jgi:hypothetical protein
MHGFLKTASMLVAGSVACFGAIGQTMVPSQNYKPPDEVVDFSQLTFGLEVRAENPYAKGGNLLTPREIWGVLRVGDLGRVSTWLETAQGWGTPTAILSNVKFGGVDITPFMGLGYEAYTFTYDLAPGNWYLSATVNDWTVLSTNASPRASLLGDVARGCRAGIGSAAPPPPEVEGSKEGDDP